MLSSYQTVKMFIAVKLARKAEKGFYQDAIEVAQNVLDILCDVAISSKIVGDNSVVSIDI